MDEVALAGGRDPLDLRRELLADSPRDLAVLEEAARHIGWGDPLPEGRARGLAVSNGFRSHSAQAVEIAQDEQGLVCIDRIVIVADVGILVTPDLVRAQLEGGSLFGLSAAPWGRITLHEGAVVEHNFDGYPILRIRHAPPVEVVLLDSDQPPSGVGEVATTTIAPALVNALAVLLGQRFRSLPLAEHVKFGSPNRRSPSVEAASLGSRVTRPMNGDRRISPFHSVETSPAARGETLRTR